MNVLDTLKSWIPATKSAGLLQEFHTALRSIQDKLTHAPLSWGDPLFRYQNPDLAAYRGMHWYVAVEYAVHEKNRLVFVREYRLLPWAPFGKDDS